MKKWESTYNNNNLRLMRVHIGFVIFYVLLAMMYAFFAYGFGAHATFFELLVACFLFFLPLMLLHGFLAIGAKNKVELARKISKIVFAFLLLGFPIGTILSMLYFLPETTWKQPDESASIN